MHLFAFGINHKTAPVAIREQATFAPEHLTEALTDLCDSGAADEATIISTCNRTELYFHSGEDKSDRVIEWFCDYHKLENRDIAPYLYLHPNSDAVKHAFRVAAGLDSLVLGEPQILGQMKEAFAHAHEAGATGKLLNRLFQQTFSVAKQVRTDTAIGASAVSVAFAAVSLAKQIFSDLAEKTVMLVGAGETIELCARHLNEQGVKHMIVANRTVERAKQLADVFNGEAITLSEMPARLADADIVVTSTASPVPILGKGATEKALKVRKHRPIFMVDIAVPRDIEPEVDELNDVYLYTVDDLSEVIQENLESRQQAAEEAEEIIDLQVVRFMQWLKSQDAVPTIKLLREQTDSLRDKEVEQAVNRLNNGEDAEEVMRQMARSLTNKILHTPITTLQQAARMNNQKIINMVRRLFNLGDD